MAEEIVCLDTSILIDYYRKKNKSTSQFYKLIHIYESFAVSAITEYEIYIGSNKEQDQFWDEFFSNVIVLSYDSTVNKKAIKISRELKRKRKNLDIPDLLIAATALTYDYPIATLNKKHFKLIEKLVIVE